MKFLFSLIVSCLFFSGFYSCTKVEGPGGAATIRGRIMKTEVNGVGTEYFSNAADEDVYLIYGSEGSFYDDDIKTSYDGSFEFNYLEEGDYQLFVYSENDNPASNNYGEDTALVQSLVIQDKKEIVDLGAIIIE